MIEPIISENLLSSHWHESTILDKFMDPEAMVLTLRQLFRAISNKLTEDRPKQIGRVGIRPFGVFSNFSSIKIQHMCVADDGCSVAVIVVVVVARHGTTADVRFGARIPHFPPCPPWI